MLVARVFSSWCPGVRTLQAKEQHLVPGVRYTLGTVTTSILLLFKQRKHVQLLRGILMSANQSPKKIFPGYSAHTSLRTFTMRARSLFNQLGKLEINP